MIIVIVAAVLIVGGIIGSKIYFGMQMGKMMAGFANMPQIVSAAPAELATWQDETKATGSVRALRGADLAAQALGIVDKISFESGADVKAGAVLLRLRLNDDPAKLEQLKASAALAEQTYKRDLEQFAAEAVSQAQDRQRRCQPEIGARAGARRSRRWSTRKSCVRRSRAAWASARSTPGSI